MKESVDGRIELHEVTQSVLEAFISWVYTGDIQLPDGSEKISNKTFPLVVQLYNFADVYDTIDLRNEIVSKIFLRSFGEDSWSLEKAGEALRLLRRGSKLYRWILDLAVGTRLKTEAYITIVCRDFPREAVEAIFANCVFKTFKGFGELKDYLESDEAK